MSLRRNSPPRVVAGIPAKDEAQEIGECLLALARQEGAAPSAVVVCLNNTVDHSARILRDTAATLPFAVHLMETELPPELSSAGVARKIAMDRAADLAGPEGILLSTDADGRAASDWLAANLAALRRGADAVAGRAVIEPVGARLIPAHLHEADARECAYAGLLDEISSLVDPDLADPWPRHDEESGASIAVTVAAYRHAGGIPPIPLAEDRAFFSALRFVDARIRHAPEAHVVVSARTVGRAAGGMADTMRRRMERMDEFLDDRLEPALQAVRRVRLRRALREHWRKGYCGHFRHQDRLAAKLGLRAGLLADLMARRYFGAVWAEIERRSSILQRRRVPVSALPQETARAKRMRDTLRYAAHQAGNRALAAAE